MAAALIASFAENPNLFEISENSFTKAILICRKVFSNTFEASATSGVETSVILSQKVE